MINACLFTKVERINLTKLSKKKSNDEFNDDWTRSSPEELIIEEEDETDVDQVEAGECGDGDGDEGGPRPLASGDWTLLMPNLKFLKLPRPSDPQKTGPKVC